MLQHECARRYELARELHKRALVVVDDLRFIGRADLATRLARATSQVLLFTAESTYADDETAARSRDVMLAAVRIVVLLESAHAFAGPMKNTIAAALPLARELAALLGAPRATS